MTRFIGNPFKDRRSLRTDSAKSSMWMERCVTVFFPLYPTSIQPHSRSEPACPTKHRCTQSRSTSPAPRPRWVRTAHHRWRRGRFRLAARSEFQHLRGTFRRRQQDRVAPHHLDMRQQIAQERRLPGSGRTAQKHTAHTLLKRLANPFAFLHRSLLSAFILPWVVNADSMTYFPSGKEESDICGYPSALPPHLYKCGGRA